MPTGPQGQKRPADAIGLAVMIGKIATGEMEDRMPSGRRKGGLAGAASRSAKLTAQTRSSIAKKAADTRWGLRDEQGIKDA